MLDTSQSKQTVLIVDDTPHHLDVLVELLGDSYDVSVATDGVSALQSVEAHPPDLILLDVLMPNMDGYEVCRRLKANPNFRDIPVVFITAMSETVEKVKGFESGGVDYVTKPFEPEEVLARVNTHLTLRALFLENEMARIEAERASEAKSRFMAAVSHELRTPMNAILGFSELLLTDEVGRLSDQQKSYVQQINQSGEQLLGLINDVLETARIDSGSMELFLETFSIRSEIDAVLKMLRVKARKKSLNVRVDTGDVKSIDADPSKFREILLNLLTNAMEYTEPEGSISIRAETTPGGHTKVSVSDSGVGIAPDRLDHLFSDFGLADSTRDRASGGLGMGLPLTRRLVHLHGGKIGADSEPGRGSTFWFTLPSQDAGSKPS